MNLGYGAWLAGSGVFD